MWLTSAGARLSLDRSFSAERRLSPPAPASRRTPFLHRAWLSVGWARARRRAFAMRLMPVRRVWARPVA